jgi:Lecithin:cholesterol acyltransferase
MQRGRESLKCPDAIVVVPGILGSELLRGDELIWGAQPKVAAAGLISGRLFDDLRGDLRPGGLIRIPTYLPAIGRFDPYQRLTRAMRDLAADEAALLEFPYDWRQPVADTASVLAAAASEHLDRWRRHPRGSSEAQLSFVCHSMGGLVARHSAEVLADRSRIRQIITLGTPFGGSVKAVRALADGRVLPAGILAQKLRRLARELPAVYDLLPRYPAVATSAGIRRPTAEDFASVGATAELTARAGAARTRLEEAFAANGTTSYPVAALVGVSQPTLQSFHITEAGVDYLEHIDGQDWKGDGTVYLGAAYPAGQMLQAPIPLQHGALANSTEGIEYVRHILLARALGPPMGEGIGIAVPDAVLTGEPFDVRITAPVLASVSCSYDEAGVSTGIGVPVRRRGDHLVATIVMHRPGLYTINASGGGFSSVRDDLLVLPKDT